MIWISLKEKEKEIENDRPIINPWYELLINYIPEPIRRSVAGFKVKVVSLTIKTNTHKHTVYGTGMKVS